jgi:hypothetical protein
VQYSADLVDRLSQLLASFDAAGRAQVDRGKALVGALTDQLASGQAESLYSLQSAASTMRQRTQELQELAGSLPEEIGNRIRESVEALAGAASDQITSALETASTRLGIVLEALDQHLAEQQEEYLGVLRESAEATGAQLSAELEEAAAAVIDSAGRAQASQNAVRAAAVAAVEALDIAAQNVGEQLVDLQEQVSDTVDAAVGSIVSAGESFAEEAEGVIQAMTSVGDGFVARMFEVLDERDAHEAALEQRLTDKVSRITADVERRLAGATAAIATQIDRLERRDLAERTAMAAELHDLVRRLLGEPRSQLRAIRKSTKDAGEPVRETPPPPKPRPLPPVAEPPLPELPQRLVRTPSTAPRKAPAKKAAAKRVAKKAPAKKAPAKRTIPTASEDS